MNNRLSPFLSDLSRKETGPRQKSTGGVTVAGCRSPPLVWIRPQHRTKTSKEPVASYKEVRIGKTLYRVTSVFSGEKDLGRTLEQLAVRRAMTELDAPATAQPCHAS